MFRLFKLGIEDESPTMEPIDLYYINQRDAEELLDFLLSKVSESTLQKVFSGGRFAFTAWATGIERYVNNINDVIKNKGGYVTIDLKNTHGYFNKISKEYQTQAFLEMLAGKNDWDLENLLEEDGIYLHVNPKELVKGNKKLEEKLRNLEEKKKQKQQKNQERALKRKQTLAVKKIEQAKKVLGLS